MKVIFEKEKLLQIVSYACSVASVRRENAALNCVRLKTISSDTCRVSAFDGEKGYDAVLQCVVTEEGSCLINAVKFLNIIRNMPSDIKIECDERLFAVITSERSKFEIQCLDAKLFPNTPELTGKYSLLINQGELKEMISQTLFAVDDNNARLQLNGAYFIIKDDSVKIVALDGLRFAQRFRTCEIENKNEDNSYLDLRFILPKKALVEVLKILNAPEEKVSIVKARKHVLFCIDNMIFYARQIDGDYIDYERFIPKNLPINVYVNPASVRDSLERALLITEDKEAGKLKSHVKLSFEDNLLKISSISTYSKVYDEIITQKTGEDIEIGFNCKLLFESFRALDADRVKIGLSTPLSAMLITPEDDNDTSFSYFVFPIRVKDNL